MLQRHELQVWFIRHSFRHSVLSLVVLFTHLRNNTFVRDTMPHTLETLNVVLQAVSTIFTVLGVVITVIGMNCETSLGAIVYRRLRTKSTHSPLCRDRTVTNMEQYPLPNIDSTCTSTWKVSAQDPIIPHKPIYNTCLYILHEHGLNYTILLSPLRINAHQQSSCLAAIPKPL